MAACLHGGKDTCASHRAAAFLWQLDGFAFGVAEITTTRNLRNLNDVIVHRVSELRPCDLAYVGSVPVTEVSRTLLDVASVAPPDLLEDALDDALRRRLTSLARLGWRLDNIGAKGKEGTSALRKLLDQRPDGKPFTDSPLERKVWRLIREAGLPEPVRQYEIFDGPHFVARVDFAYPAHKLVIEADGYRYHTGRRAWEHDLK